MTEEQAQRVVDLVASRETIEEFLSARDPESAFVQRHINSTWEHERAEGKKLPLAEMAEIMISDASSFEEQDSDTLGSWYILRDILERALKPELDRIAAELKSLGVEG
jgi:hypothetical protein